MAQINITLNQNEILGLLAEDSNKAFRELLAASLNSILEAESREQLKADPYERSEKRTDFRNGSRDRNLNTRIGTITLHVPRHRNQPFKTLVFENYSRSEAALIATMAEMVVNGVSTRKVSKVMETLCGTSYSKSAVSEVCRELDAQVEEFRGRPLEGKYPFLTVDATYFKVRENHRIISKAFMTALAINAEGRYEILGFKVYEKESAENWTDFLNGLKERGLKGLLMITSDSHEGIIKAVRETFPAVPWQRCQFHFSRNISGKAPKKYQAGLRAELNEMLNAESIEEARKKRDSIIDDYQDVAERAMECLDEGFESSMTAMMLPAGLYRSCRTSNSIERLNREMKRRSKPIGVFSNEASVIRLMGSVLIEQNERFGNGGRKVFSTETYEKLMKSEIPAQLRTIAGEQQRMMAA